MVMPDFKFNCPHCQQSLEAPEDMLGETIECPSCTGAIQLPEPQTSPPLPEPQLMPDGESAPDAATEEQLAYIRSLGGDPQKATNLEFADEYIDELEEKSEKEKPPTNAQLKKIAKLGGDPEKAIYFELADEYIYELEQSAEQFTDRANEALDSMYGMPCGFSTWSVKKPSCSVMKKALRYGDSQGWEKGWDDPGSDSDFNPYSLLIFAIYSVAPNLLKPGESPPLMPERKPTAKTGGKGGHAGAAAIVNKFKKFLK
jgi:hypothetical protein